MIDEDLSGLPRSALRDYSDDARLDRVWNRLESELASRPVRSRSGWFLAPAFGLVVFLAGVFAGRTVLAPDPAPPELLAERPLPVEAVPNVPLPAGNLHERSAAPVPSSRPRPPSQRASIPAPVVAAAEVPSPLEVVPHAPLPPAGPPEWLQLAELGDFAAARAALEQAGGFDVAVSQAAPDQLMVLVDVARASGGRDRAVRALRRLLNNFPEAPEAPLAAWTLGNMLEQSGDGVGAAEAFALYRRLSPAGDFAEDAAARQVHVALSQGNVELAVQLLDQYAKDFPNGRRLAEFREELAKLQQGALDAGLGDEAEEPPTESTEPSGPTH